MPASHLLKTNTDDPGERCADAPTDPVAIATAYRTEANWLAAPPMTGRDGPHNE
jgi:hypothetical protein